MITWRHFGKPEIVAVINYPILRASLQIRQLLTGHRRTRRTINLSHPSRSHHGSPSRSPVMREPYVIHDHGYRRGRGAAEGL